MSKCFTPRDYQERAIDFVIEHPRCALWMEMGLGKTVVLLSAITDLLESREVHRVLVISTLRVAQSVWAQEAAKWQHTAGLVVNQVLGSAAQRAAALRRPGHLWVVNVENLRWLVEQCGKRWPFDTVVFDESSLFKAHNAKTRFRIARRITPACKRVVQLTGTPAPNGLLGLWSQIYLLDQGARLGKTFGGYRERWFDSDYMGYRWAPKPFADAQIHAKVADLCLSLQAKDYLELGETVRNYIPVELPPRARDIYDQIEKEFFVELTSGRVEAENAAVKSGKLLQVANGASYLEDSGTFEKIHSAKLDALEEVIEEATGSPVLVAYQFRFDLAMLQHRFPHARVLDKNPATVEDWNAGRIPLLLAHPASAGHGLSLQDGGNICCWYGLTWSLEQYLQFNERLGAIRQAQSGYQRPVFIHHLVARDTIDEVVLDALQNKKSILDALLQAVKHEDRVSAAG